MNIIKIFSPIIILTTLLLSCTVKIPDIKVTGEKTALENQILGEYNKIKEDAWIFSSERGSEAKLTIPRDKKEIIEAIRNREFNRDDLDEYKLDGLVGENIDGLIKVVDSKKIEQLAQKKRDYFTKVITEENENRTTIMKRIMELNLEFSTKEKVENSFFVLNKDESPKGTYYINIKGEWEKK